MRNLHYGWVILGITFFSIIAAGVTIASSGVLMTPFQRDFGWDRSAIALAFGVSLFLYGIAGPFIAALLESVGLRRMMIGSMLTLLTGSILTLVMTEPWHLIIIWGVIIGLGASLFLTVISPFVANYWFKKRRGLVVGILTASTATGQLILLPLLAVLISNYSWRIAMGLMIGICSIMLLLILLFMKNKPEDVGLLPYGADQGASEEKGIGKKPVISDAFRGLRLAVKSRVFWLLSLSFFICGFSTNGLIGTHFISYCLSFGIPLVTATSILSFMGVFNLIGTTLSGWLSDRFDNRWLLFWYYSLRGVSLAILPFALMEGNVVLIALFTIFYGLDWIATVPPTINLTRERFGVKQTGIVYGWIFAFHQAGAASAAYGGGLIYSVFNSYTYAFFLAGVFCLLASLFVLMIRKQKDLHHEELVA
ncbi:MFS transporter [Geomicrobium sediminis]|uniref:MFS family arabinose efflux permease n=1 Tax=Geomicrobium sediminis TaxID=1347788 RepID=A0ABS2PCR3_9BACL|nr:MFS transporter [Geomicrobium sediminis]MBM7633104.1 putative MFS family arabinose efflux permease [Geomicrobium sediminis]